MDNSKLLGQSFTEIFIVEEMISMYGRSLANIKIMEPSFGDGAFLCVLIEKIIMTLKKINASTNEIVQVLSNNIFGYEIDRKFYNFAMKNIQAILSKYNLQEKVKFPNLKNENSFNCKDNNFDLVIGNPPYVRIQNLDRETFASKKKFKRVTGNSDLFLFFIDFYLDKLSKNGSIIFIVPNSFGKSKSGYNLRKFMIGNGSVTYKDFEEIQLFAHVSVYSCIFHFKKNCGEMNYFIKKNNEKYELIHTKYFLPKSACQLIYGEYNIKTGIATLADKIYIHKKIEEINVEKKYIKRAYKGSRPNEKFYIIFPYKVKNGKVVRFNDENELKTTAPLLYKYLLSNKSKLISRSLEKNTK